VIERAVVDLLMDRSVLAEGLDDARLSNALKFIAASGPGTDPTVLGQHHGYVLTHLKPRLNTASARAQQAGLDANALNARFSSQQNIKQIATNFVQAGKDQKRSPAKAFSALAAKNLSDHLISLSGEDQQKDTAQVQQAQQTAQRTKAVAGRAINTAIKAVSRST
jgi:hypothetical protein